MLYEVLEMGLLQCETEQVALHPQHGSAVKCGLLSQMRKAVHITQMPVFGLFLGNSVEAQ